MKRTTAALVVAGLAVFSVIVPANIITVTTVNNDSPGTGQTSLKQALAQVQEGDTIKFNIPGAGPHYIITPVGGYPYITNNNVTIDGYSQPGATPNTNPILQPNNAKLKIVLDSRNGNFTSMNYQPEDNTGAGYDESEFAILGVFRGTNATIHGLCLLGKVPEATDNSHYLISFARDYEGTTEGGHVSGCWLGVDVDGVTLSGSKYAITAFRHRDLNKSNPVTVDNMTIGVKKGSTNAPAEFNVIVQSAIPIIIEGEAVRISGNYIGVMPDGLHDYNVAYDPAYSGDFQFEGNIEIGRANNNTVIGVDGDGINDENERNVIGGVVPPSLNGYAHNIEFYGNTPGTNIVIAGNYIGVGIDGKTYFTNGVPAVNASGGNSSYRFGSDFDGKSDDLEGNVVYNNYPEDVFPPSAWDPGVDPAIGANLNFFDELATTGFVSARGNVFVNNFPFPVSPLKNGGLFLSDYYTKALVDVSTGVVPALATNTTARKLVGKVPLANTNEYPYAIIDLYIADPSGIASGKAANIPELPFGFVQGAQYLGSFVDGGTNDVNKKAGEFEFDISPLNLRGGFAVTITANYSKDPPGTHNGRVLTSPFSDPIDLPFVLAGAASVGLTNTVPDRIIYNAGINNLDNWEAYSSVLGNSTFLIEANTFAEGFTDEQRYVLAFQPATGGTNGLGEGFFADNGTPFTGKINFSRNNGNPGRVAGDKRPGAVNFIVGGEASPHLVTEFKSDNRWDLGFDRLGDGRYGTVQTFSLDMAKLTQTPLSKAFDSANGRLTSGTAPGNQITRFGGDLAALDNGNFVSAVEDRSQVRNPAGNCAVATIIASDGSIVTDSFVVANGDLWSNLAAFRGGFCVRVVGTLYFFDNAGALKGSVKDSASGLAFDQGRGDNTRIASHINSPYVCLAGPVKETRPVGTVNVIRLAVFDSRTFSFVTQTNVSELTKSHGGSDTGEFDATFDRGNLAVDALDRVVVSFETVVPASSTNPQQTTIRVLALDSASKKLTYLTGSFYPFVNNGPYGLRTIRPSIAMTTRQICVSAKGEINSQNQPALGPDTPTQTTLYTVLTHPYPADDPTPGLGGAGPKLGVTKTGSDTVLAWPVTAAGFVLQSADSLLPANWQVVTPQPAIVVINNQNTMTIPIGSGARYYRLRKP